MIASIGSVAFGQDWPKPAKSPGVDVPCNTAVGCFDPKHQGKKLIGYPLPISTFVGRYLDSTTTDTYYFTFRTARTRGLRFAPERNRIYMMIGSAVAAYNIDTFFTRLAAGENLVPSTQVPFNDNARRGLAETFLHWDRFFYAEARNSGWNVEGAGDGPDRLFDFDWDDRGNVYIATGPYGWGLAKDDGGTGGSLMPNVFQYKSKGLVDSRGNPLEEGNPRVVMSVKASSGQYYAVVADVNMTMDIWDVTNASAPTKAGRFTRTGIQKWVKGDGGTRIAILDRLGAISIYTNDSMVTNGGTPMAKFDGPYIDVATDGTNFFAISQGPNTAVVISVMSPSGGTFVESRQILSARLSAGGGGLNYGAGYLLVRTAERELFGSQNLRLYKLTNNVASEIPLNDYVAKHYGVAPPPGYTSPPYGILWGAHMYKKGSKYYLIIENFGLGDVYEFKGADSITARFKSGGKLPNVNSKAPAGSGPYYGDEFTFTSESTSLTPPSIEWDFGDGVIQTTPPNQRDIAHQYGGRTAAQLPADITVKASVAGDTSITDSFQVTLKKPTARVGILNTNIEFTAPTSDLTLPIVSSDVFVDASDGAIEGHYSEWRRDAEASVKQLPNETFSVGPVGQHSITFTGHYGPYAGTSGAIVPGSADAAFSVDPITYFVRPFAAAVDGPISCATAVCTAATATDVAFKSATRATNLDSDLAGSSSALVDYKWELVKPDGNGGWISAGVPDATGQRPMHAIPDFVLPRSAFQGADGWKARLTLTLVNASAVKDPQYASSVAYSVPLLGPTPSGIVKSGCDNAGDPCRFTTPSTRPDVNPASWTYLWSVSGPALVPGSTSHTFEPKFTTAGVYTIAVTVSNAIGDAVLTPLQVTVSPSLCSSTPSAANTGITYKGMTSGCVSASNTCAVGETINFLPTPHGWFPSDCDKYRWDFGDGTAPSTEQFPSHVYASAASYNGTLFIDGGLSDATIPFTVNVGVNGGGNGGNGGNGG
ncbi:MAG TPA: PKD domain-containing protein, partial [Thermoanaerobaculia bacterium]|nr:PKD domain-containing protein [Thermoanaerobaculia bacterium]